MKTKILYALLALALAAAAVVFLERKNNGYVSTSGVVWTTEYHIIYDGDPGLRDSVNTVFSLIENSASAYNKMSLVSQFNDKGAVDADSVLTQLMRVAAEVNAQSDSLYDPTVMPLVKLWKQSRNDGRTPSKGMLDSIRQLVGFDKVKLDGGKLVACVPGVQLDFSSIAKGQACDEMGRMLERNGVVNYMVEIGGEVVTHGVNDHGDSWQVSVDMPTDQATSTSHQSIGVLALSGEAVATSGNYRQYAEVNGKRVTHIINPRTGKAEQSDLLSVSVIAPRCMNADAWATACMVMGTKATQEMMDKRTDLGVMTISADSAGHMVVWSNAAFAAKLKTEQ
ncbi:MAG: FAD:protein FMN transferase [Muribaculaceae bacterium]|nr:FAD:protein FMN transferase [Muribaculaceae bacterium]